MDHFAKRCGCGAIFRLPNLKARTTQCERCLKRASQRCSAEALSERIRFVRLSAALEEAFDEHEVAP